MNITRTLIASTLMAALFISAAPLVAQAASSRTSSKLEVSGWIPYWRTEAGTKDARKHLSQMSEVNPFAYSVRTNGTLADTLKVDGKDWQRLIKDAEKKNSLEPQS